MNETPDKAPHLGLGGCYLDPEVLATCGEVQQVPSTNGPSCLGLMVGLVCAGWWCFHASVGYVLIAWTGSTGLSKHVIDQCPLRFTACSSSRTSCTLTRMGYSSRIMHLAIWPKLSRIGLRSILENSDSVARPIKALHYHAS